MSSFGIVRSNISSIFTNRILKKNNTAVSKEFEKLNSGMRINRAADDAAGLTVSEKMRSQLYGLDQARRNTEDGISMLRTASGALQTSADILNRMRKLAVQASTDNYTSYDRKRIQKELDSLVEELDHIAKYTEFNTKKLLNGDAMGKAHIEKSSVAQAYISGSVTSADYSVTVLDAGTASSVHGNANLKDVNNDHKVKLSDAGVTGTEELHISVDGQTRILFVNENDTLKYLANKINRNNMGVTAGLDAEGNDLTLTSIHSGSRFNISFGDDPNGVALKLGLTGGNEITNTSSLLAVDSNGNKLNNRIYTSGTDTIISITNITVQSLFGTEPGHVDVDGSEMVGGFGHSLGIFKSNSDIFTEFELTNPINTKTILTDIYNKNIIGQVPNWEQVNVSGDNDVDLTASELLKGVTIHIDEQLDFGLLQRDSNDMDDPANSSEPFSWTKYFPDRNNGNYINGLTPLNDHRAAVPNEKETADGNFHLLNNSQVRSIVSTKLSVRKTSQIFHVGANDDQILEADFGNLTAEALGLEVGLNSDAISYNGEKNGQNMPTHIDRSLKISVETQESAEHAITKFDNALKTVTEAGSRLGAIENSFEQTINYLGISFELGTESGIRNTDYAEEFTKYARDSVLLSSASQLLKEANLKPQNVLSLLR